MAPATTPTSSAISTDTNTNNSSIRLGMYIGSTPYFIPIRDAFLEQCKLHDDVTCEIQYRNGSCPEGRIDTMQEFMNDYNVHGLAINPCRKNPSVYEAFVNETITTAGIPIVTYGRDLPNSLRLAYVATDGAKIGNAMARLLRRIHPSGGTYAIVGDREVRSLAFEQEITRYNRYPGRAHWEEVPRSFERHTSSNSTRLYEEMNYYATVAGGQQPTAMISLIQTPMRHPNWTQFVTQYRSNITFLGVDAAEFQVEYLEQNYVDGLVSGLPYEIGASCFQILYNALSPQTSDATTTTSAITSSGLSSSESLPFAWARPPDGFFESNLVAYNKVPAELPPLDVDEHLLENLQFLGWTCAGVVLLAELYGFLWMYRHQSQVVLQSTSVTFLSTVLLGVFLMTCALIPLSFDDGGRNQHTRIDDDPTIGTVLCMSIPWLCITGFTMVVAALLSRITAATGHHQNRNVDNTTELPTQEEAAVASSNTGTASERPRHRLWLYLGIMLSANWTVLLCWTLIDPLVYLRLENDGLDYWNRVLSTYGMCQCRHAVTYLIPLVVFNFFTVLWVCWQAFQQYKTPSPLQEIQYIGLSGAILLQALLTGIPVLTVVREVPRAYYSVMTLTLFVLSCAILGFIFVPKMLWHCKNQDKTPEEQWRRVILSNKEPSTSSEVRNTRTSSMREILEGQLQSMPDSSEIRSSEADSDHVGLSTILEVSIPDASTEHSFDD